ncbi:hypothetical protein ENH_00069480 [Eimeria necatrix]|uniref:Uncharacterized protein n=1 Tax=Eimeria necatrix TaxID=51315 RepID=U6N2E4_9EIME|nr:hypothetical protein ENH_00069480 [Eimeria necatrix]CDJ69483.1 hypothetical protein ENH_00069480 [Eimeria necatrix]
MSPSSSSSSGSGAFAAAAGAAAGAAAAAAGAAAAAKASGFSTICLSCCICGKQNGVSRHSAAQFRKASKRLWGAAAAEGSPTARETAATFAAPAANPSRICSSVMSSTDAEYTLPAQQQQQQQQQQDLQQQQ